MNKSELAQIRNQIKLLNMSSDSKTLFEFLQNSYIDICGKILTKIEKNKISKEESEVLKTNDISTIAKLIAQKIYEHLNSQKLSERILNIPLENNEEIYTFLTQIITQINKILFKKEDRLGSYDSYRGGIVDGPNGKNLFIYHPLVYKNADKQNRSYHS